MKEKLIDICHSFVCIDGPSPPIPILGGFVLLVGSFLMLNAMIGPEDGPGLARFLLGVGLVLLGWHLTMPWFLSFF